MFNIGPMELLVLIVVGLIVIGPDKLPGLAKDAARMLRTLRDLAQGARTQLRDELGPEFADIDLRNLDPRTALKRAVLGDEEIDFGKLDPRTLMRDAMRDDSDGSSGTSGVSMTKQQTPAPPNAPTPFDSDAT